MSYGVGASGIVSANISRGTKNVPLTVEIGVTDGFGTTLYSQRYAKLIGNIYE